MLEFNPSGSKYLRDLPCLINGKADVYAVLDAFGVVCPARQHAIKKLLCAGLRGKASEAQDLSEARDAIDRAMQMQAARPQALGVFGQRFTYEEPGEFDREAWAKLCARAKSEPVTPEQALGVFAQFASSVEPEEWESERAVAVGAKP